MKHEMGVTLKWYDIGMQLLDDDDSVALAKIRENYPNNVNKCYTEMLKKWLLCKSDANWDQLATVFTKVKLDIAAKNIKSEFFNINYS